MANKNIPTVEVKGDAGKIRINKSDFEAYEAEGYELCGETPADPTEIEDEDDGGVDWDQYSDEDIAMFAASEEIEPNLPRISAIAQLEVKGFDPEDEEDEEEGL